MADYSSALQGGIFTFMIGPEKHRFDLHVAMVERLSPVLARLMSNGQMEESVNRVAVLEDVDHITFKLFSQYAYIGTYCSPVPERTPSKTIEVCEDECVDLYQCEGDDHVGNRVFGIVRKQTAPEDLDGIQCPYCHTKVATHELAISPSRLERTPGRSGKTKTKRRRIDVSSSTLGVLLPSAVAKHLPTHKPDRSVLPIGVHAKLFVFSDRYLIDSLRDLAYWELQVDLHRFKLNEETVVDFVELLAYTYEHTTTQATISDEAVNTGEKDKVLSRVNCGLELRKSVAKYAVSNAKALNQYQVFQDLIREGGDFSSDFMVGVTEQL